MTHPAQWSPEIIEVLREKFTQHNVRRVHDPFGGTGVRLGRLCDRFPNGRLRPNRRIFTATDIEDWPDKDPRVRVGDSTDGDTYPPDEIDGVPLWVVTSPVYPNGMADHFAPKDTSRRHTYRVALGRELHPNNAGRYSVRGGKLAERRYWELMDLCVRWWPDRVMVNISDFIHSGRTYPLADMWWMTLDDFGYDLIERIEIPTRRQRYGANRDLRAESETLLICTRNGRTVARGEVPDPL